MENNEFVWTPKLEKQFAEFAYQRFGIFNVSANLILSIIDDFKKSKEVKKEVLFVTYDGKEIFEGDTYWYVEIDNDFKLLYATVSNHSKPEYFKNSKAITFSTEDAAKEYVLMNKPLLSLKFIKSKLDMSNFVTRDAFLVLKDLAKQKLKH